MEENNNNKPKKHRNGERGVPGGAYRKKVKMSERIVDALLEDDMMMIPERLVDELLWPRLIDLGYDLVIAAVGMAFRREPRGGYRRSGGSRERDRDWREEDYSRFSERPSSSSRRPKRPSYEYQEVQFRSREGALDAMDYISWYCEKYDQCPVAILYEKAGLSASWTDHKYGWRDLSMLTEDDILPGEDGGWVIDLPPVESIRIR